MENSIYVLNRVKSAVRKEARKMGWANTPIMKDGQGKVHYQVEELESYLLEKSAFELKRWENRPKDKQYVNLGQWLTTSINGDIANFRESLKTKKVNNNGLIPAREYEAPTPPNKSLDNSVENNSDGSSTSYAEMLGKYDEQENVVDRILEIIRPKVSEKEFVKLSQLVEGIYSAQNYLDDKGKIDRNRRCVKDNGTIHKENLGKEIGMSKNTVPAKLKRLKELLAGYESELWKIAYKNKNTHSGESIKKSKRPVYSKDETKALRNNDEMEKEFWKKI
jgi:hypothetical protein